MEEGGTREVRREREGWFGEKEGKGIGRWVEEEGTQRGF